METRNSKTLASFVAFCESAPELRFWQALAAWSGIPVILAGNEEFDVEDTFFWEGRYRDNV